MNFLQIHSRPTRAPVITPSYSRGISPVGREVANGLTHTFTKDCNQMRLNGTVHPVESKEIGIVRMASPLAKANSEFVRQLELQCFASMGVGVSKRRQHQQQQQQQQQQQNHHAMSCVHNGAICRAVLARRTAASQCLVRLPTGLQPFYC